jgi:DNA-binding PadR family transcriptional regulator
MRDHDGTIERGSGTTGAAIGGADVPYQIEQEVECRSMRDWTGLSMSAIYKLLIDLEKGGLVVRTNEVSPQNRLRKLYEISDTGKKALAHKLEVLLSEPEHILWQVDIGTYNCDLLPKKTVLKALKNYRKSLENGIKCYGELNKYLEDCGCPPHRFAIASRQIYLLKAEVEWVDSYMKDLSKKEC